MALALSTQIGQNVVQKISNQMRAVLTVLSSDQSLMDATMPFADFYRESMKWDEIYSLPLSPSHKDAVDIAYGFWTNEQKPNTDLFASILNMDAELRAGIIRGFVIRWGLKS